MSACADVGRSGNSGAAGGSGGSALTLGIEVEKTSWDPAQQISGGSSILTWQPVFDTLLRYGPDGSLSPNAAEEFSFNETNTVLTLTLREGMRFTDGVPVDANAAKASLEHFRDGTGPDAVRLAGTEIAVVDDRTFTITSQSPNLLLSTYLAWAPGILASPASLGASDVATNPVGSGPYTLNRAESASGTSLVFERNQDYWNRDAYPKDRIVLRVMADETARLNALQSGQIDGAPITPASSNQAKRAGLYLLESKPVWAGLLIADRNGSIVPELADVRVRQAISMVFDRQAIVGAIYQGNGEAGNQIFNPQTPAYMTDILDRYPFDVDAAEQLMAEAGYADGFDIVFPEVPGYTDQYTSLVVQQLSLLDIRASTVSVPRNQVLTRYLSGEFPMFAYALPSGTPMEVIQGYVIPDAIWNVFNSEDPELAPLLEQAQRVQSDAATEVYQAINKRITDQAWFAVFGYPSTFWAFDDSASAQTILGSSTPYLYTFK
jgi:peptide/nickel transport system substrate-binding protein